MKSIKVPVVLLSVALVFSSCGTWNNTQKGAAIGVGGGAAVGAGVGALAGNTALGSVIGAAVGGAAGALIGKKMDKQKKELEATLPEETTVETINNGEAQSARHKFNRFPCVVFVRTKIIRREVSCCTKVLKEASAGLWSASNTTLMVFSMKLTQK